MYIACTAFPWFLMFKTLARAFEKGSDDGNSWTKNKKSGSSCSVCQRSVGTWEENGKSLCWPGWHSSAFLLGSGIRMMEACKRTSRCLYTEVVLSSDLGA